MDERDSTTVREFRSATESLFDTSPIRATLRYEHADTNGRPRPADARRTRGRAPVRGAVSVVRGGGAA